MQPSDDWSPVLSRCGKSVRLGCSEEDGNDVLTLASCYDAMKLANQSSGHAGRLNKYMSCIADHGIVTRPVQAKWLDGACQPVEGKKISLIPMATLPDIRKMVCYMLRRNMKSQEEIASILTVFGIEQSQFESSFLSMPEKDNMKAISRCIPFASIPQFRVGKYRIDLYFPDIHLAVECCENRHATYDLHEDLERKQFIRDQLHCRIIEYDPYAFQFSVFDVVRSIVDELVSPEFQNWRQAVHGGPWKTDQDEEDDV